MRQVLIELSDFEADASRSGKIAPPSIGFLQPSSSVYDAFEDFRQNWTSDGHDAVGLVGVFGHGVGPSCTLRTTSFGRSGNQINLILQLEDPAARQPAATQPAAPRRQITFFARFPKNLPLGPYKLRVQLQSSSGQIVEFFERDLLKTPPENEFEAFDAESLLAEYVRRGEALRGMTIEPIDSRFGRIAVPGPYQHPARRAWVATHHEILRRGRPMVPGLIKQLAAEAIRNPDKPQIGAWPELGFGMAFDVMEMLARIDDPRPVDLLINIARGMDGKTNVAVRTKAIETLQQLTRLSFFSDDNRVGQSLSTLAPDALIVQDYGLPREQLTALAKKYAAWRAGEGKDPAKWLEQARFRARASIQSNDLLRICDGLSFLAGPEYSVNPASNDDRPNETVTAVTEALRRLSPVGTGRDRDLELIPTRLAQYGPRARPAVPVLIERFGKQPSRSFYQALVGIGGEDAMTFLVTALPEARKAAGDELSANSEKHKDLPAWRRALAYHTCRWGIERGAGRVFEDDAHIADWWKSAAGQTQEQWLRVNLEPTVLAADAGNAKGQAILRAIVPGLPLSKADLPFDPPWIRSDFPEFIEQHVPAGFRTAWWREHQGQLRFDGETLTFK